MSDNVSIAKTEQTQLLPHQESEPYVSESENKLEQTRTRLFERRRKMLDLHFSRRLTRETAQHLADEYGVTQEAIWKDLALKNRWLHSIKTSEDTEAQVDTILAEYGAIINRCWELAAQSQEGGHRNAANNVIKNATDAVQAKTQFMQSVGYIPKRPEQLETRIQREPHEPLNLNCTPEEVDVLRQASRILHKNDNSAKPQPNLH